MKELTLYAGAKINIGLRVFEKRADGFHEIESIFYPVGPQNSSLTPDRLIVTVLDKGENLSEAVAKTMAEVSEKEDITEADVKVEDEAESSSKVVMLQQGISYPGAPQDNICVKAYNLLSADFDLPRAVISLEKHIPVGAGLGGGSSDGVCTLQALNTLCHLNLTQKQLLHYAAQLGSDCPFFVHNTPMVVTGRGEFLTPLPSTHPLLKLSESYNIKIKFSPECFVSTKEAYSIVPKRKREEQQKNIPIAELLQNPVNEWRNSILNDFEEPVFKKYPQLNELKLHLYNEGAEFVAMTGSGSAIFALFRS